MSRLPDFVIAGAMKCGTSSLHEQLGLRSGIFVSDPKEPNFFSDDERFARGLDWYAGLFARASPEQVCGESSTHYTKLPTHPKAAERMARHLPDVRLVYVMRDPIERLVSQYLHEWTQREVAGRLADAALAHERFAAYSCYARQLEPYLDAYGAERVLPVFFERLLADPDGELARICAFVGDPSPEPVRWCPERSPSNVSRERMRRSPVREGLLRLAPVRAVADRLPPGLREGLKAFWRPGARPELPPAVRAALEARIDPDLARLSRWLGRELSCAGWTAGAAAGPAAWVDPPGRAA